LKEKLTNIPCRKSLNKLFFLNDLDQLVYKKSKSAIEPNEDELVVEGIEQVNEVPEEVERASVVLHSFDELSVEDEGCWSSVDDRESLLDDELGVFFVFLLYFFLGDSFPFFFRTL